MSKTQTLEKSSPTSTQSSNQPAPPPKQQAQSASPTEFKPITYRAHNNYDTEIASNQAALPPEAYGESLTIQAQAEDADINVLMKRYGLTGTMPETVRIPTYGDFSNVTDYRSALEAVRDAEQSFLEIPPDIRLKFNNDPQLFLEFADNPANGPALVQLGLAKPRVVETAPGSDTPGPNPPVPPVGGGSTPPATPPSSGPKQNSST